MTSYNKIAKTDLADGALYEKVNDMVDVLNADKIELTQIGARRASAVYKLADRCFCAYHGGLLLECTTAGTTAVGQLDTSGSLKDGDVITDGSVQWTVRAVATKNELNNYATTKELTDGLATKQPVGNYALKSEIPDISCKQDKIEDLAEIRSGATKGATAVQQSDLQVVSELPAAPVEGVYYFVKE